MPITLQDAIRRVRSIIDEPSTPTLPNAPTPAPTSRLYTDTELTDWINDGLRDIARRAEDLHTYDTTISLPAYSENPAQPIPTYPLNLGPQPGQSNITSDILRITRVEFRVANDSSQVYPLEWQTQAYLDQVWNVDQLSTMSYPQFWTTRGYPGGTGRSTFVIQVYPNPAQAGSLNIFYYRLPLRISDPVANPPSYLTTLDLLEGWDDMLVDFVHSRALLKARDPRWKDIQQLYESKMANIIDLTRHFSDQSQYFSYDNLAMPWVGDSWGGW